MKVIIKKFSYRRNGVTYRAGSVIDLPENFAQSLANNSPKEFAIIPEPEEEKPAAKKPRQTKKAKADTTVEAEAEGLPEVDAAATVK